MVKLKATQSHKVSYKEQIFLNISTQISKNLQVISRAGLL
jgi:hypothetical protein